MSRKEYPSTNQAEIQTKKKLNPIEGEKAEEQKLTKREIPPFIIPKRILRKYLKENLD